MILAAIAALTFSAQAQIEGTINVGEWDGASYYNGSYFDMAPTNFYIAHTGAQMIYTPDLLADMEGKENVKITNLKFKFYCESFEEITRNVKLYLQETDATEFPKNEQGIKQFIDFGEPVAEAQLNIDLLEYYGEDYVMEFPVNLFFTPGKSLLVTIVFDAQDDDNCTMGSDYAPFYTSGISGKAMTYTDNWDSFLDFAQGDYWPNSTAILGCGTNVALPLTEISYTYEEARPGMYIVGSFNDWNQNADGGRIQFVEDKAEGVEFEANTEFKIITPNAEGGWTWYGGEDTNGVGYFLINQELMGGLIQLCDGANFRIEEAGSYDFTLVWTRDNAPLLMVEPSEATAISAVGVNTKADNAYYNLMGVKFNTMPTVPGIYIHNGKKVVVR